MKKAILLLAVCAVALLPAVSFAGQNFDGKWLTTLTCPQKGIPRATPGSSQRDHERQFPRRAWHSGSTRLPADRRHNQERRQRQALSQWLGKLQKIRPWSLRPSRRGLQLQHQGPIHETEGTGSKSAGLGIVGRTCTFESSSNKPRIRRVAEGKLASAFLALLDQPVDERGERFAGARQDEGRRGIVQSSLKLVESAEIQIWRMGAFGLRRTCSPAARTPRSARCPAARLQIPHRLFPRAPSNAASARRERLQPRGQTPVRPA